MIEEAPALAPLVVMILCTACLLILWSWQATGGQLVNLLIVFFKGITPRFHGFRIPVWDPVILALQGFNKAVSYAIGNLLIANQWAFNNFMHWQAVIWDKATAGLGDLAHDVAKAFHVVRHSTIGMVLAGPVGILLSRVGALEAKVKSLADPAPAIVHRLTKVIHAAPDVLSGAALATILAYVRAHAPTLPQTIPNPWPRIRELEHEIKGQFDRVKSVPNKLTVAGIIGLTVAALTKAGLGWIRCSNVRDAGKAVCGMDRNILESLLADTALILGTVSLVEFAQGMQGVIGEIEAPVRRFWRAA